MATAGEGFPGPPATYCQTRRQRRGCVLIWQADVIAHGDAFVPQSVNSAHFGAKECGCTFAVRLFSELKGSPAEHLFRFLLHFVEGPTCEVTCEIALVDAGGQKTRSMAFCQKLEPSSTGGFSVGAIPRKELFDRSLRLVRDHQVTVRCAVTVCGEPATSPAHPAAPALPTPSVMGEQWKAFYEQKPVAPDLWVRAGGEQFGAHRAVLACRSPVFAAMLRHDMREKQSGEVVVWDVEADVLEELLRFLYTDDFGPRSPGFVARLMVAADKYDVQSLKSRCSRHLCQSVGLQDVLEVLKVTELCRSRELDLHCWHLVNRELFPAGSMVECVKRMGDFPRVLGLLKKRLVDEEQPAGHPAKRPCPDPSGQLSSVPTSSAPTGPGANICG